MKTTDITEDGFYWMKDYLFFGDVIVDIYKSVTGYRIRGIVGSPEFGSPLLSKFERYDFFPAQPHTT